MWGLMPDAQPKGLCCSSKSALCYWGAVFVILYGVGLGLAIWLHAQTYELAILFAAMGLACVANLARNRTFHCVITAPFFLFVALAIALEERGVWKFGAHLLWPVVLAVVCLAFLFERRFAS